MMLGKLLETKPSVRRDDRVRRRYQAVRVEPKSWRASPTSSALCSRSKVSGYRSPPCWSFFPASLLPPRGQREPLGWERGQLCGSVDLTSWPMTGRKEELEESKESRERREGGRDLFNRVENTKEEQTHASVIFVSLLPFPFLSFTSLFVSFCPLLLLVCLCFEIESAWVNRVSQFDHRYWFPLFFKKKKKVGKLKMLENILTMKETEENDLQFCYCVLVDICLDSFIIHSNLLLSHKIL